MERFYRPLRNHHPRSEPQKKYIMILDPRGLVRRLDLPLSHRTPVVHIDSTYINGRPISQSAEYLCLGLAKTKADLIATKHCCYNNSVVCLYH